MPRPALRSRSLRRTVVRKPGGDYTIQYERRRPSPAHCGSCRALLSGVPRERPSQVGKLPATKKRPSRPFGGNLCPSCSREAIKNRFFNKGGE